MRYFDQHVHTNFSTDSKEPMENYIKKAISNQQEYIVFTEHCDYMAAWAKRDVLVDFVAYKKHIQTLQEKYPEIKILYGVEMGYQPKKLSDTIRYLNENRYDLIVLSIHEYNDIDFYDPNLYRKKGFENMLELYFKQSIEGIKSGIDFDVFGHFDYCLRTIYRHFQKIMNLDLFQAQIIEMLELLINMDKSLEINTSVYETVKSFCYIDYITSLYLSLGGKNIVLSSDAHSLGRYESSFGAVKERLKFLGVKNLVVYIEREKHDLAL